MANKKSRERFIEAAVILAGLNDGRFKLTDLYAQAGLSRSEFRRAFGSKAEIIKAAHLIQDTIDTAPTLSPPQDRRSDDKWIDRRFRILERAISAIESQISELQAASAVESLSSTIHPENKIFRVSPGNTSESNWASSDDLPPLVNAESFSPGDNDTQSLGSEAAAADNSQNAPFQSREEHPNLIGNFDIDMNSYWRVEEEKAESNQGHAILFIAAAVVCGILVGIASISFHAQASLLASTALDTASANHSGNPTLDALLKDANSGNTASQEKLAWAYASGSGVKADIPTAIRWSRMAASQGDAHAEYLLGSLLQASPSKDMAEAAQWYLKAAQGGEVKAMHNLGIALLTGLGVVKNEAAAASWFQKAADAGYKDSQFDLAVLYERGQGVQQNLSEALRWYDKAASSGDLEASKRADWLRENMALIAAN